MQRAKLNAASRKCRRKSKSEESLNRTLISTPVRKASTPTREGTIVSDSPDISCILTNANKANTSKRQVKKRDKDQNATRSIPETLPSTELELDIEYNRYIQAVFRKKLEERKAADIDNELKTLQQSIEKNQKILQNTTSRLKNINFNKEVDFLHSLHSPNYGKILDTVDESSCEQRLATLNQELEQARHRLSVRKMEIPPVEELSKVISDTLAQVEKLKSNLNVMETTKVLADVSKVKKDTSNDILRVNENFPVVEELLLTRTTLEISAKDSAGFAMESHELPN
uniref:Uncharacterized protein n=1 Tax=Graphocephala atropunctata TaxID=36148 RepID=A0A1B6KFW3_9HEMI